MKRQLEQHARCNNKKTVKIRKIVDIQEKTGSWSRNNDMLRDHQQIQSGPK
jgi:hypothetical protein